MAVRITEPYGEICIDYAFTFGPLAGASLVCGRPRKSKEHGEGVEFSYSAQSPEAQAIIARVMKGTGHDVFARLSTNPDLAAMVAEVPALQGAFRARKEAEKAARLDALRSGAEKIRLFYHLGSPLSGWVCHGEEATNLLLRLGLAEEVAGWGTLVDHAAAKALGEEFTYPEAEAYARPALEAAKAKEDAKTADHEARKAKALAEAKRTGKPVEVRRWSEGCDGSATECNLDIVVQLMRPDGSLEHARHHTH